MAQGRLSGIGKRRSTALEEGTADYAAKRAELINVASEVFRRKGYAAATLSDIAKELGTDRASLYYYVSSKEELFQVCISDIVIVNLEQALEIVERPVSARERLTALIVMLVNSHVEHYPHMYVYIREDMASIAFNEAEWAQDMAARTRQLEQVFLDVISEGIANGEFRSGLSTTLIANSLFGMIQWTHRWFVPGKRYSADDLIEVFGTIFFDGVMAQPAKSE